VTAPTSTAEHSEGAILIAGPTASGKSALALELARKLDGVVVNADSMQVYEDLRVLTARPTPEEETAAPHRLYGHVDGVVNFSVGRYLADAGALLAAERRSPIFVGGTGLYFRALLDGLSDIPPVPDAVREEVRARAEGRATTDLHAELAARDPATAAGLDARNRQRVLRALEVLDATGEPLAFFQGRRRPGPLSGWPTIRLFLAPDRDALRRRIDDRFRAMMAAGALDEVRRLAERRLDPALPVMRAHGVPALLAHGRGEIGLEQAVAVGQGDTRRYAKRQFTWFRHQMPGWTWVAPEDASATVEALLRSLESRDAADSPCGRGMR
jgi:tRNA dimethylallyltransferase